MGNSASAGRMMGWLLVPLVVVAAVGLLVAAGAGALDLGWARQLGGPSTDKGLGVAVDGWGNTYTTGYFQGTADFDPGPGTLNLTSAGGEDGYVSKLDSAGNLVWARQLSGALDSDYGYDLAVDGSGSVYTIGFFQGTIDFDPGPGALNLTSAGETDVFLWKLDGAGNLVWARQLGGPSGDAGQGVAVDGSGNVYATGYFQGTADFDPGPGTLNLTSAGDSDAFVSKLLGGAPANDDFDAATVIGAAPYTATQDTAAATTAADDPGLPCSGGSPRFFSVWYRYTAPGAQQLTVDTSTSTYDTVLAVWTGTRGSLANVACNDDTGGTLQSSVQFTTTPGTTYHIEITSFAGAAGTLTLHLAPSGPGAFGKAAPTSGATGVASSPTLSWGAAPGAASYEYCYDFLDDLACNGPWMSAGTGTSVTVGPISPSTITHWQVRAINGSGTTYADGGTWWQFTTAAAAPQEMTFYSDSDYDGWVLEQDEDSGKGGTFDAGVATARVGDDASNRQWRSILHFNTAALPDTAVITGVTVRIKREGIVGTSPFNTHGQLVVDIKNGAYHDNPALEKVDFQAAGSRGNVGRFVKTPSAGWYRANLRVAAYPLVNLMGATQLRLRFATDDDNDNTTDYLNFYTGNLYAAAPQLIVTYYVP